MLGAGLDTYAYRGPLRESLRIFEVDHPATQAWKRERLAAAGIPPPPTLTFAPVDFARETIARRISRSRLRSVAAIFLYLAGSRAVPDP